MEKSRNIHFFMFNQRRERLYQIFKYSIYSLLLYSVGFFIWQDYTAAQYTFSDGFALENFGEVFAQSLDTLAWYILLILFELETYIIEKESTHKRIEWILRAIYTLCYGAIIWSCFGYIDKLVMVYSFEANSVDTACDFIGGTIKSLALELDDYVNLTAENCQSISAPLFVNANIGMVSDGETLGLMKRMAATDMVNAITWLLIAIILQIDVLLQLWGRLTNALYNINLGIKFVLYFILFICAGYWWAFGTYIDFQDAALWILAFFFIELNLFKWHEEEQEDTREEIK